MNEVGCNCLPLSASPCCFVCRVVGRGEHVVNLIRFTRDLARKLTLDQWFSTLVLWGPPALYVVDVSLLQHT